MALQAKLLEARDILEKVKKNNRFGRANRERAAIAEERTAFLKCAGKLSESLSEFDSVIRRQAISIQEGKRMQYDTLLQEQELWDAALGYLMVKEARFALGSVQGNDTVEHAYSLLDAAIRHMDGEKVKQPFFGGIRRAKEREISGFLSSGSTSEQKSRLLDSIFEELKVSGNIEECLKHIGVQGEREGRERQSGSSGRSGGEAQTYRDRLNTVDESRREEVFSAPAMSGIRVDTRVQSTEPSEQASLRDALNSGITAADPITES